MALLPPSLILSGLISTLCGAAFHLWRGKGYAHLARYLLAAWIGFALGQGGAWVLGVQFAMVGQVHIIEGIAGCLMLLMLASWLKLQ
jgi:hypothetical protein